MATRARKYGGDAGGGGGVAEAGGSSGAGASDGHPSEGPPEDGDDDAPSKLLAPLMEEWRDDIFPAPTSLPPCVHHGWHPRGKTPCATGRRFPSPTATRLRSSPPFRIRSP